MIARVVTNGIAWCVLAVSAGAGWEYAASGRWLDATVAGGIVLLATFGMGTGD